MAGLSRRHFLVGGSAAAATGAGAWALSNRDTETALGGLESPEPSTTSSPASSTTVAPTTTTTTVAPEVTDRVLVVLQLGGGNDGLNTLVPDRGRYRDTRAGLSIPEADVVSLGDGVGYGVHPALEPLLPFWESQRLAFVQGVGFAEQSRSHFDATDYWWAAQPRGSATTGWLGRWIDEAVDDPDPLTAVAFGSGAPALLGERTQSTLVRSPERFQLLSPRASDQATVVNAFLSMSDPLSTDPALARAQLSIGPSVEAVEALAAATGSASAGVGSALGAETAVAGLQASAGVIEQNPSNRVVIVGVNGFDTHANQLATHAGLLADVAEGVVAFFERLEQSGNADRVVLMTTSEFGRRVAPNGSAGTDHGTAGLQFIVGSEVAGGQVVGDLDLGGLVDGDVPITVDTRSYYAAGLSWLGGPVEEILDGASADDLGLI
ncbi:MAG: DUF1501 domain-containing protein [Acidimicrobiales bacterium]